MSSWFITGASRGLGAEIARAALESGHVVAATARDPRAVTALFPDAGDALLALPLDVTDEQQARTAVEAAANRFGGIDVLVNNAGRGVLGAVEEVSDAAARAVYETNVFGTLNVLRAALPGMRARRSATSSTSVPWAASPARPAGASTPPRSSPWRACPRRSPVRSGRWASR